MMRSKKKKKIGNENKYEKKNENLRLAWISHRFKLAFKNPSTYTKLLKLFITLVGKRQDVYKCVYYDSCASVAVFLYA